GGRPGLAGGKEANGGAGVAARVFGGADDAEEDILLRMVEARLRGLGVRPGADGVLLIAHGSPHEPFQARWHDSLRGLARLLVKRGMCAAASHALLCCEDIAAAAQRLMSLLSGAADGFGERAEKLAAPLSMFDAAPSLGADEELGEHAVKRRVAVVPVFLSRGYFTTHVIPERLADVPVMYDGQTLLPYPALSRWLEREAERLLGMLTGRLSE
ncbi:CbiX/SirB N-terminal domain-containing protein, partial [Paenibacillus apiarius]|uniref:CbiX/SirB N-terminal domain-containing protein n=1 Tax=Paenibacillus apiarius TaxID=46240 RepID=UPI003B3B62FC